MREQTKTPNRAIKLTIESRLENVGLLGVSVNRVCVECGLSDLAICHIELAVVEAVTNCIVHAYERQTDREVEATISVCDDRIQFEISDDGKSLDRSPTAVTDLSVDPGARGGLPEGGMGLFLINSVMDSVSYDSRNEKNVLTLVKSLRSPATLES